MPECVRSCTGTGIVGRMAVFGWPVRLLCGRTAGAVGLLLTCVEQVSGKECDMGEHVDAACPITRAADAIGDRWMLQILRQATVGVTRFDQFRTQLGIADNVLANRLGRLVTEGLLVK